MGLALMPSNIDELYIDQINFLSFMYGEDRCRFRPKPPDEIREMDSNYCQRIMNQAHSPEDVKNRLLNSVETVEKLWKEYFKKNAQIFKSKQGTLTFVNPFWKQQWERTKEKVDEMLKYVGESPGDLREEIICNPHLHPCIKENLLYNLDRVLEEKKKS